MLDSSLCVRFIENKFQKVMTKLICVRINRKRDTSDASDRRNHAVTHDPTDHYKVQKMVFQFPELLDHLDLHPNVQTNRPLILMC